MPAKSKSKAKKKAKAPKRNAKRSGKKKRPSAGKRKPKKPKKPTKRKPSARRPRRHRDMDLPIRAVFGWGLKNRTTNPRRIRFFKLDAFTAAEGTGGARTEMFVDEAHPDPTAFNAIVPMLSPDESVDHSFMIPLMAASFQFSARMDGDDSPRETPFFELRDLPGEKIEVQAEYVGDVPGGASRFELLCVFKDQHENEVGRDTLTVDVPA